MFVAATWCDWSVTGVAADGAWDQVTKRLLRLPVRQTGPVRPTAQSGPDSGVQPSRYCGLTRD